MRSCGTISRPVRQANTEENSISQDNSSYSRGQIAVVGIGPGNLDEMTPRALKAITEAEVIIGYDTYLKLISAELAGKKVISSAMLQEVDRCEAAVREAQKGSRVVVVSSGDPGIYGMAGLILELVGKQTVEKRPAVEVIAGISAVGAAAAVLGAPLMHDFAVISLSDLLTPWLVIEQRVQAAASADFVIALYNPKSIRRTSQIEAVREITLKYRPTVTPVGIVKNAGRTDQHMTISNLDEFTKEEIDMFTLVIIGNSQTFVQDGRMITPRGYKL